MIDSLLTSLKNLSRRGQVSEAFKTFSLLQLHVSSNSTNNDTIFQSATTLLSSCTKLQLLTPGKQLHAHLLVSGFETDFSFVPKLVTFYSTFNLLVEAHVVTEHSNVSLDTLPWNLVVFSYVKNGLFGEAILAYKRMVNKGVRPNNFTYPAVLKACADVEFGREVHKSIEASSQPWCSFVHNALIAMYLRFGVMDVARHLFDTMPVKDAVSCNTIISAYASRRMWDEAFELFESQYTEEIEMSIVTWNIIAGGFLKTGKFARALGLIPRMRARGVEMDSVALVIGLGACSHMGAVKFGKAIQGFAVSHGVNEFANFKNKLITMYSRCGDLRHAYSVFQQIENKNVVTWNSMLSGYAHMDRAEEASFLFREMMFSGIKPSCITIASILPLCARVANLQHGKEFHCYITRRQDFGGDLMLLNAIVDMYARSGKVLEAKRVFDLMTNKDKVTYTSIIAGYGVQGEGQAALKLFEEMNELKIRPDQVTMVAVLSACSHSGLVAQGKALFETMSNVYGINPRLKHYSCMIDLYGRAGMIQDAREAITRMPYKPSPALWATLIGACRIHGDAVTGEWAAEKLLEMRPNNSGYYVLIANMYAAARCWDKLAVVRTLMRELGVKKNPGCAWVDVGNGLVSFVVGDISNPEIYVLLGLLTEMMRDEGYTGDVEDVLEE